MTVTSYLRGHEIELRNGQWYFIDTGKIVEDHNPPCARCGRSPTPEGYDACLGHIPGAISACCGHGVEESYVIWELNTFDKMERDRLMDYYDSLWEEEDDDGDSCFRCGPWCDAWMGDGLCEHEINYQVACQEFYDKHYVLKDHVCPIPSCGKRMTLYKVPCELWQWPGDWLSPMIALNIYAMYGVPKGIVHSFGNDLHHVWIGTGEHRRECLIATNCVRLDPENYGGFGEG